MVGKDNDCWVGKSIANGKTSGLMRKKSQNVDSSKSIEYIL
jgi:hypothetical protein